MTTQIKNTSGVVVGEITTKSMTHKGETSKEYQVRWFSPTGTRTSSWDYDKDRAMSVIREML
jgi:hypothetical protein